jgi:hypothetical protein
LYQSFFGADRFQYQGVQSSADGRQRPSALLSFPLRALKSPFATLGFAVASL